MVSQQYCISLGNSTQEPPSQNINDLSGWEIIPLLRDNAGRLVLSSDLDGLERIAKSHLDANIVEGGLNVRRFNGPSRLFETPIYGKYRIGQEIIACYTNQLNLPF